MNQNCGIENCQKVPDGGMENEPEWLIYAKNEQLYIQLAVCQENEKV